MIAPKTPIPTSTVITDALTDLERQRVAHEQRAAVVAKDPQAEHADRYSIWSGEALEQETRNVRLDMAFGDPISIRDQAELLISIMRDIITKTKEPHLGEIKQRIEARRIADFGRRHLTRLNGKMPSGTRKVKKLR